MCSSPKISASLIVSSRRIHDVLVSHVLCFFAVKCFQLVKGLVSTCSILVSVSRINPVGSVGFR